MNKWKIIFISIGSGGAYWIVDSFLDAIIFREGSIVSQMFAPSFHEIYVRFLVIGILMLLIYFTSVIFKCKQVEKALYKVQEHLRTVLNNAPITIFAIDKKGVFTLSEGKGLINAGLKPGENVGVSAFDLYGSLPVIMPTGEVITGADVIHRVLTGETMTGVTQLAGRYFDNQFVPFSDKNNQVVGIIGVAIDITDKRKMEEELKVSNETLISIIHASPLSIFVLDKDGIVRMWNPASERIFGWKEQEVIGKPNPVVPKGKEVEFRELFGRASQGETLTNLELVRQRKDGSPINISLSTAPIYDAGGNITGVMSIIDDITERKKAEIALIEEKNRTEAIVAAMGDGISIQDTNYKILYQNQVQKNLIGDHVGEYCYMAYERKEDACEGCPIALSFADGKIHTVERSAPTDKGTIYAEITTSPLRDASGKIIAGIEVVRDITKRKNAEEALRKVEQQQKAILDNIPDIAWLKDKESRFIIVNDSFGRTCGVSPEDLIGKTDIDIWPRDLAESYRADDREVMKTGRRKAVEEPLADKEGKIAWIETIKTPIFNDRSEVIGTTGIARDITERKKTEEILQKTTQTLKALINSSPLAIIALDKNWNVTLWNPAAERIFGWKDDEVRGRLIPTVPDERIEEFKNLHLRAIKGESVEGLELRRKRKDGSTIDISLSTAPIWEKDGSFTGVVGIIADISERKKMEEEILRIKQDWEDTFNTITDMITIHDEDFNIIRANKAAEKILGLPFLEKTPDSKCFKYYHGAEKPPEGCPSCQCLKTGVPATFELFEPHLNMFIEIRAIPRFGRNNRLIGLIHVVRDITDRKRSEQKLGKLLSDLSRAKMEWEVTFDTATEFIILVDKALTIIRCNKSFADYFGIPIKDMIGKKYFDYLPFETEQLEYLKSKIREEEATEWIEEKTKEGYWFYVSHRPVFDEKGKFLHSVIIATDITILKNSQEKLIKSEEELRKRIEELEKFYEMAVGRELKMKEMKGEIKRLNAELAKYKKDDNGG